MLKTTTRIPLPAPAPGSERSLIVHRYGRSGARPKAYFHAGLHADEHPGLLVLHHLMGLLDRAAADDRILGEVIVVPFANPIGLSQHLNGYLVGRFGFDSSGNFNRNFPDLADAVLPQLADKLGSDVETNMDLIRKALRTVIDRHPVQQETAALKINLLKLSVDADYVFDLHCDSESLLHIYASIHHRETALTLGAELGAAVVLLEDEAGGSPFDETNAGIWWKLRERLPATIPIPLGCFSTTVELRGQADVSEQYAQADAANLLRFLERQSIIAGDPPAAPPAPYAVPLDGVDILAAPAAGILAYCKNLGDTVAKGDVIADLVDVTASDPSKARTPLRCQTSGLFFARMATKLVRPGQHFCKIAGQEKLAYRKSGKLLEN